MLRRVIIALVFAIALSAGSRAEMMTTGCCNGGSTGASASGLYSGPGDVTSGAIGWWGLRGYNRAYTGNAIQLKRTSDNTTQNVTILTGGDLDVATAATFCNSTTCNVIKWYDQSGNGNDLPEVATTTATYSTTGCTSANKPCVTLLGDGVNNNCWATAGNVTVAYTLSYQFVGARTGHLTASQNFISSQGGQLITLTTANWEVFGSSGAIAAATDSAFHTAEGYIPNGGTGAIVIDNAAKVTASTGSSATARVLSLGCFNGSTSGNPVDGRIVEGGVWSGVQFSDGNMSSIDTTAHTYWGF